MTRSASPAVPIPELIRKKRDGAEHSAEELGEVLFGYLSGRVKDYQMASWLMAVYFRGLTREETHEWTRLMWRSGVTFPRADRVDFWIDKHSTGGVGDKTSLILVPLVTSICHRIFGAGKVKIPMVSGRGLGHSGGTLDKLESVPGFRTALTMSDALELLRLNGFFMMGQTADLAPADRLLYALRDVTATVECVPLIVSSILSKKLSENLDGLVLDIKFGSGAFMKTETDAALLARALFDVARAQGLAVMALLTRMEEPLGWKVGNRLEVEECRDYLAGTAREKGLDEVVLRLATSMVFLAGRGRVSLEQARAESEKELEGTQALSLFRTMFQAQGGEWNVFDQQGIPPRVSVYPARAHAKGYLSRLDAMAVGQLVNALGGGRSRKEDAIDPDVGVEFFKKCGDAVDAGEVVAKIYYRSDSQVPLIEKGWDKVIEISGGPIVAGPWVSEVLS